MPERFDKAFQYFISPAGSDESGDGSAVRPFHSMRKVVTAIAARHGGRSPEARPLAPSEEVEIVCIRDPGVGSPLRRKPRFNYFLASRRSDGPGDGTEISPWGNLDTALSELVTLHDDHGGAGQLRPGERLQLKMREVFTMTAVERRKGLVENMVRLVLMAVCILLILPLIAILVTLVVKAFPALSFSFLLTNPKNNMTAGGIWAPLIGTFYLVFISLAVAAPVGILAGVYLNEYARDNWLTRIVNLAVLNLAGVPSIVHALFGVGAFVLFAGMGRSVLAASCTLAVMTLPVVITSTREGLAAVPMSFREACWNMGASRWQTIRTIVLPNSFSGILTGVILQVSRAAGETAPILFTGAIFYVRVADSGLLSFFPYGLLDRCMALSYHLFTISTQVHGVPQEILYGTAVVLIALVLLVNALSIAFRVYLRSRKRW
jgi:phosphate transport system permease protein